MRLPSSPNQPPPHLRAMLQMQQQPRGTVGASTDSGNNPHRFRHGVVTPVPIFIIPDQEDDDDDDVEKDPPPSFKRMKQHSHDS